MIVLELVIIGAVLTIGMGWCADWCDGGCKFGCSGSCNSYCWESCSGTKNKPILVKIPHIYISYSIEVLIYKHADKLKYFRQFND